MFALICVNQTCILVYISLLLPYMHMYRTVYVCVCVCVLHMLDSFFKQYQVHDSMQLIIMLQCISQCLLEFLPV